MQTLREELPRGGANETHRPVPHFPLGAERSHHQFPGYTGRNGGYDDAIDDRNGQAYQRAPLPLRETHPAQKWPAVLDQDRATRSAANRMVG